MSALTSDPKSTIQRRISVGGLTAPGPDIFLPCLTILASRLAQLPDLRYLCA